MIRKDESVLMWIGHAPVFKLRFTWNFVKFPFNTQLKYLRSDKSLNILTELLSKQFYAILNGKLFF